MRFYYIGLGVWIFVLILTMVNSLGIFSYQMPTSSLNASSGNAEITQLTNTMSQSQDTNTLSSIVSGVGLILNGFGYLIRVFLNSVYIIGLGNSFGIPLAISGMFQAIYSFILVFGIYQFLTGRAAKIME